MRVQDVKVGQFIIWAPEMSKTERTGIIVSINATGSGLTVFDLVSKQHFWAALKEIREIVA